MRKARGNGDLCVPGLGYNCLWPQMDGGIREGSGKDWSAMSSFEIRSRESGGHWIAWVVRTPDGKPAKAVVLVGRTQKEAEQRAREWAESGGGREPR
jgi:hypothetical protein